MDYISTTEKESKKMLETVGVKDAGELFSAIPSVARINELKLPGGIPELALTREFEALARKNASLDEYACFRGAGIYDHFVPALVGEITGRSEFSTAYTPYQPEASQGTLQAIFEYQSMICALTGLDVANASLYDGASSAAEAALLALRATGRKKILISGALHPEYRQVIYTYLQGTTAEIIEIPLKNGFTSLLKTRPMVDADTAALIVQTPNFLGTIEDTATFRELTKSAGALLITVVNPISLGILKSPGEIGADIAVGEGQSLGNETGAGGITFGFMACKKELAWKMPGRIVGQTTDNKGRRGFVLTLQSREQHIRREKATSNICTNAALNALAGCVYLAGWGPAGLQQLAEVNLAKSHYAFERISKISGFNVAFPEQKFFNEFVLQTTKDIGQLEKKLLANKIIGPLALRRFYPELSDCLLFCVTEMRTKAEIDSLVTLLAE
ncbi:MAG: glycine dehydrogenase (aminomethyl-transferring) [Elusimicrobia bacterium RIFOXYB2_FULL_50_12]|nr:MAG: glycine dehydrogenase (aminomethyl-transferring) [Elusimicrobia bacterium RIFOXYB2_FULL_50_12]